MMKEITFYLFSASTSNKYLLYMIKGSETPAI